MSNNLMMKSSLTTQEQMMVESEMGKRRKNKIIAYALWACLCSVGAHRFYLKNTGYAIAMICFGWATAFIWPLVDVFFIGKRLRQLDEELEKQIITEVKVMKI